MSNSGRAVDKTQIHDKLITDISALTFSGGSSMFNSVNKLAKAQMGSFDAIVFANTGGETISGNSFTERVYGFTFYVEDYLEKESDSNKDLVVDRLSNIEEAIKDMIEKEPSNLRALDSTIFNSRTVSEESDAYNSNTGIVLYLRIRFNIYVTNTPQLLP